MKVFFFGVMAMAQCEAIAEIAVPVLNVHANEVCPGEVIFSSCSVFETSFLRWSVGSMQIICPGSYDAGSECIQSTNQFHAVVTNVSWDPTDGMLLINITSSLRISNGNESINITCESQRFTTTVLVEVLSPPPPPTGLNVTVDGSRAKIVWNCVESADFYRVEVYAAKSDQLFHFSNETETQKQVILRQNVSCLSTMQFVVNISTCDRCGQWSKVAASTNFSLYPPGRPQNLEVVDVFHIFLGLRWDPPLNPNGVITSYRVEYMSPGGSPQTRTVSVQDYERQSRNYQLDSLSYGTVFNIRVAAINCAGEGEMTDPITNRTTIGVFAPQISSSGSQDGSMYRLDINPFDESYGPLSHYKIVVVLNGASDMDSRTVVPDDILRPYDNDNQRIYAAASINVGDYQRTFIIGDGQSYTWNNVEFMNSPLCANQDYVFFVRLYSSNPSVGFNDSRATQVFRPQPAVNVIIAPIAAVALLLLIIFLILIFIAIFTRKSRVKRHRLDDGLVNGKKKPDAVELIRTRRFSPVLNVATSDVFTSAGQPTTLICEASGTPAPDVSWTCNDKPLDKERFIQLADGSLFIQDTDLQDEGSYLVVATNSVGTTEQMVRVTVSRPVPPEPDAMHKPIPVGDFTEHIVLLRANDDEGLKDEYADLDLDWNFTSYAAKLNINKNKNRYVDIIPYDHARVVLTLQDNTPGSDYINASYIDGYNQPNAYIATQGPIPSTFPDFWRMVWELDCPTIVMVTNLKEDDKVKCNQYWPSYGTTTYGSLQVTLKEVENLAEYSIRTFNVLLLAGQSKVQMPVREVRQFHFLVWPNHGVPQYATALLSFRKRVVRYHAEKRGPMVVHCSAGVGRTGTFITIDAMLKQLEAENIVDIFNFVRHMRFRRNYMVQTSPQYVFLHDALLEAIMCGDTSIPAPELCTKLQSLVEVDPETDKTRIATQFETLVTASPPDEDFDTTIAELPDNKPKNRFNHHLPSNELRVTLSTDNDQSDYICASFVDGYRQRVAFIVTQAPMQNTIGDFWRMIWEQKSAAIVMLTELEEGGKEMCVKYWPVEVGQPEVFGAYQVELSDDEREVGDYITRKFKLSPIDKPQESRIITQLHYIHWPRSSAPSNTRSIIDLIDQLQRVQRTSGNGLITVHCDDGLGRTGAFCTLYTVLERVMVEQVVDVFQAMKTIRIQRAGMLESLPQYEFVHKAVLEFLDSFSDYQNFK